MSHDVAEPVQLAPLDAVAERFLAAWELIDVSFDTFVCLPFPVCYSKDFST